MRVKDLLQPRFRWVPPYVHNIELNLRKGGQLVRATSVATKVVAKGD